MSNDTTASANTIKTWQERTGNHNVRSGSVKHMIAGIADLRAALARAPLPAQEITYTVDGEVLSPIEYINYLHGKLLTDPAQADDARDAARFHFIEEHATMHGGGNGFTITCFVGADEEDMGIGIDKMIAASLAGKDKP